MIGTAGLPHVIIRFFTVPKVKDVAFPQAGRWCFIAILYTTAPSVASMARLNLMQTVQPGEVGAADGNLKCEERPQWMKNWEKTGLLEFEDKNGDGRIQYYDDTNPEFAAKAESYGWAGNEMVKVDKDIMVLANPEIAKLPNWVIALVVAGGLAAALSTAAGLLLAISSAVSHDLLKGVFKPDISEKDELKAGRISMVGAILLWLFRHQSPDFAAGTVAIAFGLAASSIFPALMLGIFYKPMNREGAIAGMVAGISVTLFYVFQHKGIMFIQDTAFLGSLEPNWFWDHPQCVWCSRSQLYFLVAFVVCKMSTPPPSQVQDPSENIRVPKEVAVLLQITELHL